MRGQLFPFYKTVERKLRRAIEKHRWAQFPGEVTMYGCLPPLHVPSSWLVGRGLMRSYPLPAQTLTSPPPPASQPTLCLVEETQAVEFSFPVRQAQFANRLLSGSVC